MAATAPPAYAWEWFARQRLLWRQARSQLAQSTDPIAARYRTTDARSDVVAQLRRDYPGDPLVQATVDGVVREVAFLGRTNRPFATLGITSPPRGLRWWWTALTGEVLEHERWGHPTPRLPASTIARQLSLDEVLHDVLGGYGDG